MGWLADQLQPFRGVVLGCLLLLFKKQRQAEAHVSSVQVFHTILAQPAAIVVHFGLHGCHHKFPTDAGRLVFPPLPAATVAAAAYGLLRLALPQASFLRAATVN